MRDARDVITAESRAVSDLLGMLDRNFVAAVELGLGCEGRLVVTGVGKSGVVGQKISATLASTGTPSLFLHAAEALHGDLGRIVHNDVVLALSNSGNSEEVVRLVQPIKSLGVKLIAMTSAPGSKLGCHADVCLSIGVIPEACPLGLVPTASTTAMMVLGDALAVAIFNRRGFGRDDYARFHPGGELGRKLMKVSEVMRRGEENPVIDVTKTVRQAVRVMTETRGHPGAVSVVDRRGKLVGFFTDGDLRRLILNSEFCDHHQISAVMHKDPKRVEETTLVAEAARLLAEHHIDQIPVVDRHQRPVGLFDVQDLLSTRAG